MLGKEHLMIIVVCQFVFAPISLPCFIQYLGAVEVTESRGTQVCSTAARQMKAVCLCDEYFIFTFSC